MLSVPYVLTLGLKVVPKKTISQDWLPNYIWRNGEQMSEQSSLSFIQNQARINASEVW